MSFSIITMRNHVFFLISITPLFKVGKLQKFELKRDIHAELSVCKSDTLFRPYGDVDVIVGLSGIENFENLHSRLNMLYFQIICVQNKRLLDGLFLFY
jgi:hypothetical protein